MEKIKQTQKVLIELCNLTIQFVRKYHSKYYYQYRGDLYDLAMDFYCEFLTPKGRNGVKETLLDKFDESITTLPYLVKISVIRKLIDRSRADKHSLVSFDNLVEEYGDLITKAFNLITNEEKESFDEPNYRLKIIKAYNLLEPFTKNSLFAKLYDSNSPMCEFLEPTFKFVNQCPVQQITDKTAVLFVKDYRKCINFSLEDGHARGPYKPFVLSNNKLEVYQSGFDRNLFEDYCISKLSKLPSYMV